MTSMQGVSGAGRSPSVIGLDIIDNIIRYIHKEEEKVARETGMIRDMVIYRARFENGRPIDRYQYSIRRREWERFPLYQPAVEQPNMPASREIRVGQSDVSPATPRTSPLSNGCARRASSRLSRSAALYTRFRSRRAGLLRQLNRP